MSVVSGDSSVPRNINVSLVVHDSHHKVVSLSAVVRKLTSSFLMSATAPFTSSSVEQSSY